MADEKKSRLQLLEEKKAELERKLKEEKERVRARERKVLVEENRKKRKERNQELYAYGGLCEIAGLVGIDKGAVLGMLLTGAKQIQEKPEVLARWKSQGDSFLAEREQARKVKKTEAAPHTQG